jgi:hypothetical protein
MSSRALNRPPPALIPYGWLAACAHVAGLPAASSVALGRFVATAYLGDNVYVFAGTAKADEIFRHRL